MKTYEDIRCKEDVSRDGEITLLNTLFGEWSEFKCTLCVLKVAPQTVCLSSLHPLSFYDIQDSISGQELGSECESLPTAYLIIVMLWTIAQGAFVLPAWSLSKQTLIQYFISLHQETIRARCSQTTAQVLTQIFTWFPTSVTILDVADYTFYSTWISATISFSINNKVCMHQCVSYNRFHLLTVAPHTLLIISVEHN